jgi:DNA-directed RNA polymerase specialized sigma24 family protein
VGDEPVTDAAVAGLLHGLPPSDAEVMLMRVVGGLSVDETATVLHVAASRVRRIEARALNQAARRLAREHPPAER